jgi:hypothetical protein
VNRQLVKSKPELHKQTFLKPLHKTAEFCSTCHKVHLPPELNHYKWLRGQNHYDAYLLSGVSGHGVQSFYYPPKATPNCAGCHMPLSDSGDFGARDFASVGTLQVHGHQFPAANTAIAALVGMPAQAIEAQRKFQDGVMRIDLFGIKEGGAIDGALHAPLRPTVPELVPGKSYLLETVVRTVKMGHLFTQGTADSNEVWVDLRVTSGDRTIGRSGGLGPHHEVDPWAHFANVFMLDRNGNRIDRRNAQDIFVPLYNHQIPPGAADVMHYRLDVPSDVNAPVTVEARLYYRKFDTTYMQYVYGANEVNELPIVRLAEDRITFPVAGSKVVVSNKPSPIKDEWQRWNDYGIGLLRKAGPKIKGELTGAEVAFAQVEKMGRPDGPLNLARVYLAEGTVGDKAVAALGRAAKFQPPPPAVDARLAHRPRRQAERLPRRVDCRLLVDRRRQRPRAHGARVRLLEGLHAARRAGRGALRALAPRARAGAQGGTRGIPAARRGRLREGARARPRERRRHYNLGLIYFQLGDKTKAKEHMALHQRYKPDDNAATGRSPSSARRIPPRTTRRKRSSFTTCDGQAPSSSTSRRAPSPSPSLTSCVKGASCRRARRPLRSANRARLRCFPQRAPRVEHHERTSRERRTGTVTPEPPRREDRARSTSRRNRCRRDAPRRRGSRPRGRPRHRSGVPLVRSRAGRPSRSSCWG